MDAEKEVAIFVGTGDTGFHYKAVSVPRVGETITFRDIINAQTTTLKVIEVDWYIVAGTTGTRVSSVNVRCELIKSVLA